MKSTHSAEVRMGVTYPIYHVDKCLSVALLEGIDYVGRLLAREDCLDKRGELVLWNCVADQALPQLFMWVENDGWIRRVVRALPGIKTRRGRAAIA